jgi:hypothetical protein
MKTALIGYGVFSLQPTKNNRYHAGTKQIPYVLMYSQLCHFGLSRMNLSPAIMQYLYSEDDLEEAIKHGRVMLAALNNATLMQEQVVPIAQEETNGAGTNTAPATNAATSSNTTSNTEPQSETDGAGCTTAPATNAASDMPLLPTLVMLQLSQHLYLMLQLLGLREGKVVWRKLCRINRHL